MQYPRQSDLRPIYAETDIVLCPSRNESMLIGIPVVDTDIPGHRTQPGDEEAGLLSPSGTPTPGRPR